MIAVLLEEKLVSHTGDVVADQDVTGDAESLLFMIGRHGVALVEIEMEKAFEALDGVVAVFGDDRLCVDAVDEKLFEQAILGADLGA